MAERSLTLSDVERVIRHWSSCAVRDPAADRDALEAIVAELAGVSVYDASRMINFWRADQTIQNEVARRECE